MGRSVSVNSLDLKEEHPQRRILNGMLKTGTKPQRNKARQRKLRIDVEVFAAEVTDRGEKKF